METRVMMDHADALRSQGFRDPARIYWNSGRAELYAEAESRGHGRRLRSGALVCLTGKFTGRAPKDKFLVKSAGTAERVWWGKINRPFAEEAFPLLRDKQLEYLTGKDLFVQDCYVGADSAHRVGVRVVSESPWHALFARNMFLPLNGGEFRAGRSDAHVFEPDFLMIHTPSFEADPARDGTNSGAFIVLDIERRMILIGGTHYAGEIKKAMFTVMNYLLPEKGIFPMHCSANIGKDRGDVAIFFGLSGTGKTTLSTDTSRRLIGDDEHAWSDDGVFNFEGGCYAKVINLSPETEPQIYGATGRYGTILENVVVNGDGAVDYGDDSLTENTRASYPLDFIDDAVIPSVAGHPRNVFMLSCDANGVLPPISRLSLDQARYWFLSGYTAKVAGTEAGVREPSATFSACFGAPFLPLPPLTYADLLSEKVKEHRAAVWLVNTGWSGGPCGVGARIAIPYTRAMVNAALSGALESVLCRPEPVFGMGIPEACPGVPNGILDPRSTWQDPAAYDERAERLREMVSRNYKENFG